MGPDPRFTRAFPAALADDVKVALEVIPPARLEPQGTRQVTVDDELIEIPYRIYNDPPVRNTLEPLTAHRGAILDCLYSRHSDGFIRQQRAERILPLTETWTVPFVVLLVGEYVVEIVKAIEEGLEDGLGRQGSRQRRAYGYFALQNPDLIDTTRQRVISYWNCYYRDVYPDLTEYPGFKLVEALRDAAVGFDANA